ncbi:MAG TPA: ubiquitin-like domain-containing protein [Bacillota bacterium]|nr:ubiquitin-like domain-containing protein [Bacillota bacterium]
MNSHKRGFSWVKFGIILTIALVVAGGATLKLINNLRSQAKNVVLNYDGYSLNVTTHEDTVEKLLTKYDIALGPGDELSLNMDERLEEETEIILTRAMELQVMADGQVKTVHLTEGNVQEVLDLAGVKVREQDVVNFSLDEQVMPNDVVKVTRIDEDTIVETEGIPYKVITRQNNDLEEGVNQVVQEGEQGVLERKISIVYEDGVEVSRSIVGETVTREAEDRIVDKGTARFVSIASRGRARYSQVQTMEATAYTAGPSCTGKRPGDSGYGRTASGAMVQPYHTIAASNIPFGARVYIPELVKYWGDRGVTIDGIFVVQDRGGAIKGNKIDIYMEELSQTRNWGRRNVTMYILD